MLHYRVFVENGYSLHSGRDSVAGYARGTCERSLKLINDS